MKTVLLLLLSLGLLSALVALLVAGWIQWRYDKLVLTDMADAPTIPVAIVFGAGVYRDGRLSPMLRDRMDTAIALYRAGVVHKLLVSGDNRYAEYSEPGRMFDYAVAQGVPATDVVRDYAGRRTYDTCYRAKAIFGVERALLVTQRFHLPRAIFTCRGLGVDALGFSADRRIYLSNTYYQVRDAVASVVAWWDVRVARPQPVLGEREPIKL